MNLKKFFIFFILFFFAAPIIVQAQEQQDSEPQRFVFAIDEADEALEGSVEVVEQKPFLSDFIEIKDENADDDILLQTDFSPTYRVNQIK